MNCLNIYLQSTTVISCTSEDVYNSMIHYNSQRVTLDEDGVYMWCMNLITGYVCFMISTLSPVIFKRI